MVDPIRQKYPALNWHVWPVPQPANTIRHEPLAAFTRWDEAFTYGRWKYGDGNFEVKEAR